ncbi:3-dehydroquinate dehydratase [Pendulispora rubella]|uniref:3-dehydroquinate dehydratase n=1 Tax=Pendulispora rubella TaxID=2741070 RepID=A0ABZ2LIL3_9BACT
MPREKRATGSTFRILTISGPNLQLLGTREPEIYGTETLADIHARLDTRARELGCTFVGRQTNHEGEIVTWIGEAPGHFDGILLNPGAYTHTSIAIYDALRATGIPCVEVHLSNPDARESFRRRSRVAPACLGRVAGFGGESYLLALAGLVSSLKIWSNDGGRSK